MARSLFGVPASSATSERVFGASAQVKEYGTIPAGIHRNMEAVFGPENFRIFFGAFRSLSCAFRQELVGNHRKKSGIFPAGILLPCFGDFRCIPAGSSVFTISFLQVPWGSGHRNLRPGGTNFRRKKTKLEWRCCWWYSFIKKLQKMYLVIEILYYFKIKWNDGL